MEVEVSGRARKERREGRKEFIRLRRTGMPDKGKRIKEKGKGKGRICRRGDPWSRNDNIREHSVRAGKAKSPSLPFTKGGRKKERGIRGKARSTRKRDGELWF